MPPVILAVDQGSSSSRCVAFDARLEPVAVASRPVTTAFPAPGRVEHDAGEIADGVLGCLGEALAAAGAHWPDVAGIGLAAQTETFIVWDAATGQPVCPAISWRDTRTADACRKLRTAGHEAAVRARTGLPLEAAFAASKLSWLLDELLGARAAAARGRLLFGDVGCWLTWRLSGGAAHVTDPSMASRTMLFDLASGCWDESMLNLFGVPAQMLPEVLPSAGRIAVTDASVCGGRATIGAIVGDQQAALFGPPGWCRAAPGRSARRPRTRWKASCPTPARSPPGCAGSGCSARRSGP